MGSRITLKLTDSMTELPNELKSHVKEIVEKHVHACNDANGRRKTCKFDRTHLQCLSHYCAWLEINKAACKVSILDQHNNNKTWEQMNIFNEDFLNVFWK